MRRLDEWRVTDTGTSQEDILANGNRMLMGNGYLGYRGTTEEADGGDMSATIVSGLYDRYGELWREPVNAPNALSARLFTLGGEALTLGSRFLLSHEQGLDFRYGIVSRVTSWKVEGVTVTVRSERFASMASVHSMLLRYAVETDGPLTLVLERGIDCAVRDLNGPHLGAFTHSGMASAPLAEARTLELGIPVRVSSAAAADFPDPADTIRTSRRGGAFFGGEYVLQCRKGVPRILTVHAQVSAGSDPDAGSFVPAADPFGGASGEYHFREELSRHKAAWDAIWADGDVVIEGDDDARRALRYSLYQLQIIAPRHGASLSIPARGLSGQTYKGAVFWDTEMFMAPYFLATDPAVARSFVGYRVRTLEGARRKAAEYGLRGAFYAWESQETGDDACSDFNVTDVFTGRPQRTYFRDKQLHISADVVYGIREYLSMTGDWSILADGAFEVIVECARFYLSCVWYSPVRERYEILDVIGPDEYHERVNNNAFTNRMALLVFRTLRECEAELARQGSTLAPEVYAATGFDSELPLLADVESRLYVPAPGPDGVIEQFDGYFRLEDASVEEVKSRLLDPKEYWGGRQRGRLEYPRHQAGGRGGPAQPLPPGLRRPRKEG